MPTICAQGVFGLSSLTVSEVARTASPMIRRWWMIQTWFLGSASNEAQPLATSLSMFPIAAKMS